MAFVHWRGNPPASEAEIDRLKGAVAFALPEEYLALLRRFNGGEGAFALAPLWLQLWSTEQVVEFARFAIYARRFHGHLFFGSNGAAEYVAMRRRSDHSLEIVAIDLALGAESAQVIARDFGALADALGK